MNSIGFLINPQAGRVRGRVAAVRAAATRVGVCREATDLAGIGQAARELVESGAEILAINGGDGTVQGAITAVLGAGLALPELAIIPGGTTNMTANDFHGRLSMNAAMEAAIRAAGLPAVERARVRRPLIEAKLPSGERQVGLFLSAGATLTGMDHFRENVGSKGLRDELSAGISLVRGLIGLARGEDAWSQGPEIDYRLGPDEPWHDGQALVIATTLERLIMGLRPWWGSQPLPMHVTAIGHEPRRLLRRAPALLRGRGGAGLGPEEGYRSDNAGAIELRPGGAIGLDGEVFPVPAEEVVSAVATPPVSFLNLSGGGRRVPKGR